MLDISKVKAISLDLDDTLWPILPVILRAEAAMSDWLAHRAPQAAHLFAQPERRQLLRQEVQRMFPGIGHDLSTLRREIIRHALTGTGEDVALVEPAYQVFWAERMRVDLFADVRPALTRLAPLFPLIALSNGNADLQQVGVAEFFHAGLSAQSFGVGKPDPKIFHAAAMAAGVGAHEVLHVGDDAALDVLGGLGVGMQTVWVNRHEHLWTHENRPHATVSCLGQLCDLLDLR
jgi:HAD superfamily hydrolase (TIGR01549 family)